MRTIIAHKADTESSNTTHDPLDAAILREMRQAFSGERYLRRYPHVAQDVAEAFDHYYRHGWKEGKDPSDDFDTVFYRQRFQRMDDSDICPLEHFVCFGHKAGLPTTAMEAAARRLAVWDGKEDPSVGLLNKLDRSTVRALIAPHFDERHYLSSYPDVAAAGIDPLEHYLDYGWREGRLPRQGLDMGRYAKLHTGPRDAAISPLLHYAVIGRMFGLPASDSDMALAEERSADTVYGHDIAALLRRLGYEHKISYGEHIRRFIKPLFSPSHYRSAHELSETISDIEAFFRYLTLDLQSGASPGPLFSDDYYLEEARSRGLRPLAQGETPFVHWLKDGIDVEISPCPAFSAAEYLHLNPDVERSSRSPFEHFINYGMPEGRRFSRLTDVRPGVLDERSGQPGSAARRFCESLTLAAPLDAGLSEMRAFLASGRLAEMVEQTAAIDPLVGHLEPNIYSMIPPWHDGRHHDYQRILAALPVRKVDFIVLMPFCKLGGADFVGSVLAHTLQGFGSTLVIRTDAPDWERPDWFPADVGTVDLSPMLQPMDAHRRQRLLYELIVGLQPKAVFNVNSRTAFDTFAEFGERLAQTTKLFSYFFCADRSPDGREVGYPVQYFSTILDHSAAAIIDNKPLADQLIERFCLTGEVKDKVRTIYTPTTSAVPGTTTIAEAQRVGSLRRSRRRVLWAGRLDRQKRFDLVLDIARQMPDVDFDCWGKPVLDAGPDLSDRPANLRLHDPFISYDDLPLADSDGWLYTAEWDGIPTILIELGAKGVPMVASAVGGVAELIDEQTGWPLAAAATTEDYVEALQQMLDDPSGKVARARALQDRVRRIFTREQYATRIGELLSSVSGESRHAAPNA